MKSRTTPIERSMVPALALNVLMIGVPAKAIATKTYHAASMIPAIIAIMKRLGLSIRLNFVSNNKLKNKLFQKINYPFDHVLQNRFYVILPEEVGQNYKKQFF